MKFGLKSAVVTAALAAAAWASLGWAQAAAQTPFSPSEYLSSELSATDSADAGGSDLQSPASINGTIVDQSGAVVSGACIKLIGANPSQAKTQTVQVISGTDGQFFFPRVAPGAFQLTVTAAGFAAQTYSGNVHAAEVATLPPIALALADMVTEVQVSMTQVEVAEQEIKIEEKQRVLGAIPNFYVSYIANAAPLDAKQKFKLAFRTMVDPFTVFVAGAVAGIEQGQNHFAEYGQGTQGYAKRFGASYADATTGTLIGAAILPAILKQDPRYFYKGSGSKASRALYAIANAVICKGDNRRWQPNYSNILGSLAAGGISNLYYPEQDRNGFGLTFANAAIGIGSTGVENLMQEFIVRRLTPKKDRGQP